jgi:hypothetical protein
MACGRRQNFTGRHEVYIDFADNITKTWQEDSIAIMGHCSYKYRCFSAVGRKNPTGVVIPYIVSLGVAMKVGKYICSRTMDGKMLQF